MTDHTNNLMYFFEVENPVMQYVQTRPSFGGPSSSKKQKIGGKLLNIKVRT